MIGSLIHHYEILEELGAGGMGVVYKARDTRLDRFVAIKFLATHARSDATAKSRFIQEAKAASALEHANIGVVHDIGETESGSLFIAMSFYDGESLEEKISRGPLPIEECIRYAIDIAEGLGAAHEAGIVHRDIKPANVLVTIKNIVKIIDFGLAKMRGQNLTKEDSTVGTVAYMSPEQATGSAVDHRTDIWSHGVLFYEMLSGVKPFRGDYEASVLYSLLNESPEDLRSHRSDIPSHLAELVEKSLQKDPALRFQSIQDVPNALRRSSESPYSSPRSAETVQNDVRLAILPLENFGGDPEQLYFANGITEEIITNLSRLESLHVISRRSVMRYMDSDESIPEIASRLNVEFVVEGSVYQREDRVRISARLVDARTDRSIWSDSFEDELSDVLTLQANIARAIAEQVAVNFSSTTHGPEQDLQKVIPEAYRYYLKGLHYRNVDNPEAWAKAVEMFEASLTIDDAYAPTFAGLVMSLALLCNEAHVSIEDAKVRMRSAIRRAFELNPDLSEAHVARAFASWYLDRTYDEAEKDFQRAIELDPGNSSAYYQYGWVLIWRRDFEKAATMMNNVLELDPLSAISHFGVAQPLFYSGQYDQAIEHCETALALESEILVAAWTLGMAYTCTGQYEAALEACDRWEPHTIPVVFANLALIHVRMGNRSKAETIAKQLVGDWENGQLGVAYGLALTYAALQDREKALNWLEISSKLQLGITQWMYVEPVLIELHDEPRFKALVQQRGLKR